MKKFIKSLIGKNMYVADIQTISDVEIIKIHRIVHDRCNWTIVVAEVSMVLNSVKMQFTFDTSIQSERARRDNLTFKSVYYPLDYRGVWLCNDIHITQTNDLNNYTIYQDKIPQLMAYIIPFIKELNPKIIYR